MPKLKKVIAGLALSTALGGGALAVGATAASASTIPSCGYPYSNEFDGGFNNTFQNASFHTAPFLTDSFRNGCGSGVDLDDIFWDIYVAGHHSDAYAAY
ncbi:hypothetical protein GCM10010116_56280 [Microbispora rosea subsp. aerata]|nr:hypothetical protein [Microbispora rosea]GGO28079.1 hypothetical protein GCM10010116_56280 [Microbispora rosea subsp. aerata]GIH56175.1 hypothetical protein Mro02_30890 [Microbispora rosea subsp. aerata]GLJ85740.1 hypothetical protein GCM10017588_44730 [Microbispora rosea subsp. aerata]